MLVRHYARSLAALRCVCTRRHVGTVNSIVSSTMECGPGTPPRARFSSDARGVTGSLAPPPPGNSELASLVQTVNDLMEQLKPSDTLRPSPSYSPFVAAIKACLNEGVPSLGLVERIAAQDVPMKISFELATLCMKSIVVAGPRALPIASRLADVLAEQHVFPDVTTCDGVITIASNNGQNELVVKLFEYMAKSGLDATQRSCLKAAESYAVLGRPEVGARLLTHLCDTSTDAIPPQAFDTVIQGLHGVGRLEDAFALFQLASGRNVNVRISASLPILQAFSHDAGRVLAIFRHFLRFGSLSKPKDREKVTHALVTIPESVQLPKLLSLLGSANVHPTADENLTNTLLTVFTAKGDLLSGARVWDVMRLRGLPPDSLACSTWMKSLIDADKPAEAMALFDRMLANNLQPDNAVLVAVLKTCAKLRDFDRAKLYWRMLQKPQGARKAIEPLEDSYSAMVNCALAVRSRVDGLNILDQMRGKGVKPSEETYRALILLCDLTKTPHIAFSLMDDMLLDGIPPTEVTWIPLLQLCGNSRSADLLRECILLLDQANFEKNQVIYELIVHGFTMCGEGAECLKWFNEMRSRFPPTKAMYFAVMGAAIEAKRYDSVQELHELSKADGIEDDGSLVGQLIRSVAMQGNFESALEQLTTASKDAAVKVFLPAYSGLVLACSTEVQLKQCFELLRKLLLDQDIVVPVSLFSDLTAACGRVGTAQDGLNALKMLLDTRTPPDNGMFNQLLNLCARENRPDLAQGVVDMMTEAGVRPTPETFSIINKAREDHDSSGTDVSGGETEEEEHTSLRPQRPIPVPPQQQDPVAPLPPRRGFSKPRLKYGQTTLASATFAARIASKSEELASMLKNTPSIKHEQRVKPPQRSPSASTTTARRAPIPPRKSKPASVPQKAFPPRSPPATASPSAPQPAEAVVSVTSPTADAASTFSPSGPLSTRPAVVELEQKPGGPSAGSFTREGLSNMTVVQLKEVLKTAGLKTSGLKSELIQRLVDGKKHTVPSKPRPSSTE